MTGRVPSSRANARDLRRRFLALLETRISPGVYPELAEGVEMTKVLSLRAWRLVVRRAHHPEQSRRGAINFLEVVLFNIFKVKI